MMVQRRRMTAMLFCLIMLLSLFVSSACIVHEMAHPHECSGHDCPICQFIAQVEQIWRGFALALLALLLMGLAMAACRGPRAAGRISMPALCTLVGRKIRLND